MTISLGEIDYLHKMRGTCVQLCPTGALSFQTVLGRAANWDSERGVRVSVPIAV